MEENIWLALSSILYSEETAILDGMYFTFYIISAISLEWHDDNNNNLIELDLDF